MTYVNVDVEVDKDVDEDVNVGNDVNIDVEVEMDMYVDLEVDVDMNVNTDSEIWLLGIFSFNHLNGYAMHSYKYTYVHKCVILLNLFQNSQKTYIYHTSIDMLDFF